MCIQQNLSASQDVGFRAPLRTVIDLILAVFSFEFDVCDAHPNRCRPYSVWRTLVATGSKNEWINLYYTELCTSNTIYSWTYKYFYTNLYSPRYTQPVKVYNSALNKTIHLFKVNDYLHHNIHIYVYYIKTYPNEFGSRFNILIWYRYSELKVIITVIKIRI